LKENEAVRNVIALVDLRKLVETEEDMTNGSILQAAQPSSSIKSWSATMHSNAQLRLSSVGSSVGVGGKDEPKNGSQLFARSG
jgi:hypothetical protein